MALESSFSYAQKVSLAIMPKITSALSIIGSCLIIYHISRKRKTQRDAQRQVYHRILLALSTCDLFGSIGYFVSTWAIPKDDPQSLVVFNVGNSLSCNVQGFTLQFGVLAAALYNTCLSVYFLLATRYQMPDRKIKQRIEPVFHTISILVPLLTSIIGLRSNYFNPTPTVCWVSDFPRGCKGDECIRGENYRKLRSIGLVLPIGLCIIVITVSMCMLYASVRKVERASAAYSKRWAREERPSGGQSRIVFKKALLYIVSFAVVWTPVAFQVIIGKVIIDDPLVSYISLMIVHIFGPLQGIINFLIFRRKNLVSDAVSAVASSVRRLSIRRRVSSMSSSLKVRHSSTKSNSIVKDDMKVDDGVRHDMKLDDGIHHDCDVEDVLKSLKLSSKFSEDIIPEDDEESSNDSVSLNGTNPGLDDNKG